MADIVIIGTYRRAINVWDLVHPLINSQHRIVKILLDKKCQDYPWLWTGDKKQAARNNHSFPLNQLDQKLISFYTTPQDIEWQINQLDYDILATGCGQDAEQIKLRKKFKNSRWLFTEYGFLPWKDNAYFIPDGIGHEGTLGKMTDEDLYWSAKDLPEQDLSWTWQPDSGELMDVPEQFIYLPLQCDQKQSMGEPDFKFSLSQFKSNKDFIVHVCSMTDLPLGIKKHPFGNMPRNLPPNCFVIPDKVNKNWLYSKMTAMCAMNSTSVIEAMLYGKPIYTYADDVFSNKSVTHQFINSEKEFNRLLDVPVDMSLRKVFLRQIYNHQIPRSMYNDVNYLKHHPLLKSL